MKFGSYLFNGIQYGGWLLIIGFFAYQVTPGVIASLGGGMDNGAYCDNLDNYMRCAY